MADFLNIMASKVKSAVKAEKYKIIKILWVVDDSSDTYVELGLYRGRKVISQNYIPKRELSFNIKKQNFFKKNLNI